MIKNVEPSLETQVGTDPDILEVIDLENEEAILDQYRALICQFSIKYAGMLDPEDAAQAARIGVIKGIRSYDPSKGVKLITWLYHTVRGEVQHTNRDDTGAIFIPEAARLVIQQQQRDREKLEEQGEIVDLPISKGQHSRPNFLPSLLSWDDEEVLKNVVGEDSYTNVDQKLSLQGAMVWLNANERMSVYLTVVMERTYKAGAEHMTKVRGCIVSPSSVYNWKTSGLKKLRAYFVNKNIDFATMLNP